MNIADTTRTTLPPDQYGFSFRFGVDPKAFADQLRVFAARIEQGAAITTLLNKDGFPKANTVERIGPVSLILIQGARQEVIISHDDFLVSRLTIDYAERLPAKEREA